MLQDHTMAQDRFWDLIRRTIEHEAQPQRQLELLRQALGELTVSEVEAFERAFQKQQGRAHTWDLRDAASLLKGSTSDDEGFEYFERWLISKGREVFEAAVTDPDSLADRVAPDAPRCEFEEFATIAGRVWAEKTGVDPWKDPKARFPCAGAPPPVQPSGIPFEADAADLSKRFPKLWARLFEGMEDDRFWGLIGRTLVDEADPERQLESLREVLRELTASEIEAFERTFQVKLWWRSYSWDLWGAAHILNGWASDDGFEYFRCWLISKGREVFEKAVADPESLAGIVAPDAVEPYRFEFELFANVTREVWTEKTGMDPLMDPKVKFPSRYVPLPLDIPGTALEADTGPYLAKRYPKLWARFGRSSQ